MDPQPLADQIYIKRLIGVSVASVYAQLPNSNGLLADSIIAAILMINDVELFQLCIDSYIHYYSLCGKSARHWALIGNGDKTFWDQREKLMTHYFNGSHLSTMLAGQAYEQFTCLLHHCHKNHDWRPFTPQVSNMFKPEIRYCYLRPGPKIGLTQRYLHNLCPHEFVSIYYGSERWKLSFAKLTLNSDIQAHIQTFL